MGTSMRNLFSSKSVQSNWFLHRGRRLILFISDCLRILIHGDYFKFRSSGNECSMVYTAISRKVVGKSARDNPERYCGWLWGHFSSRKFGRMAREAMDIFLRVLKESNKSRFDSFSRYEQCIDHIPYYLSGLSRAHFFRQPFSKQLYTKCRECRKKVKFQNRYYIEVHSSFFLGLTWLQYQYSVSLFWIINFQFFKKKHVWSSLYTNSLPFFNSGNETNC